MELLIQLLVVCIIIGLVYWVIGMIPLPDPIRNVVYIILVVIAAIFLINMLLGLSGSSYHWRFR